MKPIFSIQSVLNHLGFSAEDLIYESSDAMCKIFSAITGRVYFHIYSETIQGSGFA